MRTKDGRVLVAGSALHSFDTSGVDWTGRDFRRDLAVAKGSVQALWLGVPVPSNAAAGEYETTVTVGARGLAPKAVRAVLRVSGTPIPAGGDDEPERLSRLRWLDSRLAQDDGLVPPYTPVVVKGRTLSILGRTVELDASGFPRSIRSHFTPEVTSAAGPRRELLAAAIGARRRGTGRRAPPLDARRAEGDEAGRGRGRVAGNEPGRRAHRRRPRADRVRRHDRVRGRADEPTRRWISRDVRLELPLRADAARYAMGLGWKGGTRPDRLDWAWDVAKKNQDAIWVGDVNAGVQFTLQGRPLRAAAQHQLLPAEAARPARVVGQRREGHVPAGCRRAGRTSSGAAPARGGWRRARRSATTSA